MAQRRWSGQITEDGTEAGSIRRVRGAKGLIAIELPCSPDRLTWMGTVRTAPNPQARVAGIERDALPRRIGEVDRVTLRIRVRGSRQVREWVDREELSGCGVVVAPYSRSTRTTSGSPWPLASARGTASTASEPGFLGASRPVRNGNRVGGYYDPANQIPGSGVRRSRTKAPRPRTTADRARVRRRLDRQTPNAGSLDRRRTRAHPSRERE